jgi:nitrite reductase/ring-hydroxylating ferredoxin subunit
MRSAEVSPPASAARDRDGHLVCAVEALTPGNRTIVQINNKSIGVFNVQGRFYALRNGCPHKGGALCEGPITGTVLPTDDREFVYGHEGRFVRCAWHGWEFDITTGVALADPSFRARSYPVTVDAGNVYVHC